MMPNRTPSPSQQQECGRASQYRKHSPWTAARQKKKTRCVQSDLVAEADAHDICNSPGSLLPVGTCGSDIEVECSLAADSGSGASGSTASPHCSPPLNRGENADVHPGKAYIVHQKGSTADLLCEFASVTSAGVARSPLWFGSAATNDRLAQAGATAHHQHSELQYSSSAPSNVLFHKFDAIQQHQHDSHVKQLQGHARQDGHEAATQPAVQAGPLPGRRRRHLERRCSWTGADVNRPTHVASLSAAAAGSVGISRLGTSSRSMRSNCTEECNIAGFNAAAGAASCASSTDDGFVLHSRLGETHQQMLYEQRIPWGDLGNDEEQEQVRDAAVSYRLPAAEQLLATAALESADWYEERLLEAAEAGDLTSAQQLWSCMQAAGVVPTRKVINSYLMCCYYGGSDPVEAEQVVHQMCLAAGSEPDSLTARLLANIDISWQQLHCGR